MRPLETEYVDFYVSTYMIKNNIHFLFFTLYSLLPYLLEIILL